jgi:acyl-CoA reductase-like NAD-dependent aldehyde dehydrogenase
MNAQDPLQGRIAAQSAEANRLSGHVVYDGKLRRPSAAAAIEVENPATEEIIGHVPRCGAEDVEAAVGAAEQAFRPWSSTPPRERGALLVKAAGHLDGFREDIARLSSFETGNALATQSRGEARTMVDILRYFGGLAGEITGKSYPPSPGRLLYTRREPLGVVGAIIPWNAPLMQLASKIAPALAAGNTVVLKSAEQAPLAVLRVFELLQEVLPAGVANLISGVGEEAGRLLCEHPAVRKITFTGSSAVGAKIMHYAADKIIPVTAELGGKNPNIVLADANIERAAKGILQGLRLQRQGQSCSAEAASIFTTPSMTPSSPAFSKAYRRSGSANPWTRRRRLAASSRASSSSASCAMSKWRGKRRARGFCAAAIAPPEWTAATFIRPP